MAVAGSRFRTQHAARALPDTRGCHSIRSAIPQFQLHMGGCVPGSASDPLIPRAVRLRIVLASGEELVRLFALNS